jgi:hypothetical protein
VPRSIGTLKRRVVRAKRSSLLLLAAL